MFSRWLLSSVVGLAVGAAFFSGPSFAVQVVTEAPNPYCEEIHLTKTLKLYKDPALFLSTLNVADSEPDAFSESPLLTTLTGTIQLMRLGPPREFRNFGAIQKVYELAEPKLRPHLSKKTEKPEKAEKKESEPTMVVPVKVCGDGQPYSDTLGFVLLSELRDAQIEDYEPGTLPPSTYPNPIPSLKSLKSPPTARN